MSTAAYGYFDEAYFEDGQKRGTAYVNYRQSARSSPTYREIASAVLDVFRPKRVLEIGCATGMIVRHLNDLGCEAHGIDVSEWAVRNAEHRNVKLASADNLPFPDRHFDLVMSCHSLEHLPDKIFDKAIYEITRVSSAYHFHMLPIVGLPPYDGDPEEVRRGLRKDPTHQQLHELDWWINQFTKRGQSVVEANVLFKNDTESGELSSCQFVTTANPMGDTPVVRRARLRNQRIFRDVQLAGGKQNLGQVGPKAMGRLSYTDRIWKDVEYRLIGGETVNLTQKSFLLAVIVEGSPCTLRFAAGQDIGSRPYAAVGELYVLAKPGCNIIRFGVNQLTTLRGSPNYSEVNHLAFGGENENAEVVFYLGDQDGQAVLA